MFENFIFAGETYSFKDWQPISTVPEEEEVLVHGKFGDKFFVAPAIIHNDGSRTLTDFEDTEGVTEEELAEFTQGFTFGELLGWQPFKDTEEDVRETILKKIDEFVERTGTHPTHLLMSADVLQEVLNVSEVNADNCDEFKLSKGEDIYKIFIMGLPVKIMVGEGNIFPAVL